MNAKKILNIALASAMLFGYPIFAYASDSDFEKQQAYESWLGSEIGRFIERGKPPQNVTPNGRGGSIYTFIYETKVFNGYDELKDIKKDYAYFYVNSKNRIYAWKYIKSDGANVCDDPSGLCSIRSQARIQEHRRLAHTSLSAWIGEPIADRLKQYKEHVEKQNSRGDEDASFKKDSIGASVFTMSFPADSVSYPGGGYVSLHANTHGIIYGWSGVIDGKELCVNPDMDNICMTASGAYPGASTRGRVGLLYEEVKSETASAFGLPKPTGALIIRVEAGNLGERSGLKVGDIITKVNGVTVENLKAMPSFGKLPVGTRLTLTIWRKRASQEISFTLDN